MLGHSQVTREAKRCTQCRDEGSEASEIDTPGAIFNAHLSHPGQKRRSVLARCTLYTCKNNARDLRTHEQVAGVSSTPPCLSHAMSASSEPLPRAVSSSGPVHISHSPGVSWSSGSSSFTLSLSRAGVDDAAKASAPVSSVLNNRSWRFGATAWSKCACSRPKFDQNADQDRNPSSVGHVL